MTADARNNGATVARRAYELRLDRADPRGTRASVSAFLGLLDPEVEFALEPAGDEPLTLRGRERVGALLDEAIESWETCRYEVLEATEVDHDHVLVTGWAIVRRAASAQPEMIPFANLWTVHEGRVVRIASFRDQRDALASLGPRVA